MSHEIEVALAVESAPRNLPRTLLPDRSRPLESAPSPTVAALRAILSHAATLVRRWLGIVLFLAAWEFAPRLGLVEPSLVPPFSEVVRSGFRMVANGIIFEHIGASLVRSLSGFFLALVYSLPLGLAIGWSKRVSEVVNPLLELARNTAALALLPVFILLLGIGEASKIALVAYACSWPILLNAIAGVRGVDPLLVRSARTMGVDGFRLFQKVLLPASVPTLFVGIRLAGAASVLVLIAAEMVGARSGLGYLVQASQYNFQIPEMYVGIVTITLTGLAINTALQLLERSLTSWKR
jgi:NitT/TauT family transport system permease protein